MGTKTAFSYLIRPSSIYNFRVIVPPDLRGVVGKKENLKKSCKYRGKTIQEVLKMDAPDPMSATAVNKYLNRASSLFKFAVRNGFMSMNPAEGMQIAKSKRDDEFRSAFTKENLRRPFHPKEYLEGTHRAPYAFWMPILALFTGYRLEELAQLHLKDIREVDGVWVIDINNEGGEKGKNQGSYSFSSYSSLCFERSEIHRLRKEIGRSRTR